MNSRQYIIQSPNVNIGGSNKTQASDNYHLSTTLGQLAAGEFQANGYIIKAGFQYINSIIPFTFSISKTNIDLGDLTADTPKTDSATLSVSFGAAGQYTVTAIADSPLKTFVGNSTIPHTACDSGYGCAVNSANRWSQTNTYGFGYSMDGDDLTDDFISCAASYGASNCYRPFADQMASQDPATIMSSSDVTLNITPTPNPTVALNPTGTPRDIYHQSTITFKVNVSGIQTAGSYNTVINFVATPGY